MASGGVTLYATRMGMSRPESLVNKFKSEDCCWDLLNSYSLIILWSRMKRLLLGEVGFMQFVMWRMDFKNQALFTIVSPVWTIITVLHAKYLA